MKNNILKLLALGAMLALTLPAYAHVVVSPKKVGVASWVTFNVSVPNEKDSTTTQIKILIPEGVDSVTPTVKPNWKVTLEKNSAGTVSAIVWVGTLPSEFREDFSFSAHVPGKATNLVWKAYQTYEHGVVVAWDVDPTSDAAQDPEALEKSDKGPYSVTNVVDDLTGSPKTTADNGYVLWLVLAFSVLALIVSFVALARTAKRRNESQES